MLFLALFNKPHPAKAAPLSNAGVRAAPESWKPLLVPWRPDLKPLDIAFLVYCQLPEKSPWESLSNASPIDPTD